MKRMLLWGGGALLVVIVSLGVLAYAFFQTYYPVPPAADFPAPKNLAEAQRQDLQYFRHYLDLNRAYSAAERDKAAAMLTAYEARAGRMTPAQFELAITRMVGLADNGHSSDYPGAFRRHHDKLPCMLYHFSDGYYVVRARPACQDLLGAKLLTIDGHAVSGIADRAYGYVSGPRNHFDQYAAPFFLESPALLNAMGMAAASDRVTLGVEMPDGTMREVAMTADPPDPKWPWWVYSDAYLSPLPVAAEGKDWKALLPADAKLPAFLRQYDLPFRSENWPDKGIYYFAIRANADAGGHSIGDFVRGVEKDIAAAGPRVVVADLRLDQGGNLTTTAGLMSHITTLAPTIRHVYVLTSAWTFSAGITSVALAKQHGGGKVTIVGEAVGDRLRFWAEGREMTLPNSQSLVHYATGMHDYSESCWGERGCFWLMALYPMQVKTLQPDVVIPYSFADYRALRDPLMDYVLRKARSR